MLLRTVPARTGLSWVRFGFACLLRQPLQALLLVLVYVLVIGLLPVLPVLGGLLSLGATQLTTLGFMQASRQIAQRRPAWPSVFLLGLQGPAPRVRSMLLLCLLYALALLAVLGLSALADGGSLLRMVVFSAAPAKQVLVDGALREAAFTAMLAYLPVAMAFWFAPALVAWWGMGVAQALFTSFVVVLRNFGAFMLFVLQWWGLFAAGLLVGLFGGSALGLSAEQGMLLVLPISLLLFTPFALSFQASVFSLLGDPAADAAATPGDATPPRSPGGAG